MKGAVLETSALALTFEVFLALHISRLNYTLPALVKQRLLCQAGGQYQHGALFSCANEMAFLATLKNGAE